MIPRGPKVFLSSTSDDLVDHRSKVLACLDRLPVYSIAMERFGARSGTVVEECREAARSADLLILVVAHRYGWVPTVEQGGDGRSSITRIELEAFRGADRTDVLVYLVDPEAPWTGRSEQDDLLDAARDPLEVARRVRALLAFRRELEAGSLRALFSSPEDLATKVQGDVANWLLDRRWARSSSPAPSPEQLQAMLAEVRRRIDAALLSEAYAMLASADTAGASTELAREHAQLRFSVARRLFDLGDEELRRAATRVVETKGEMLNEAHRVLGTHYSLAARTLWEGAVELSQDDRDRAAELATLSDSHLTCALDIFPLDPDANGTLGGLLKRWARWIRRDGDEEAARALEDRMLDTYLRGSGRFPNAYCLLNHVEQRARIRAAREGRSVTVAELFLDERRDLRSDLERALALREQQWSQKRDRPWPAFDLARGRHYLDPDPLRLLDNLAAAVDDARAVSDQAGDRWKVLTAAESLEALIEAGVPLPGLSEGVALLRDAVESDDWHRSSWGSLADPWPTERALRDLGAKVAGESEDRMAPRIDELVRLTRKMWTQQEEARFQRELAETVRRVEGPEKKAVRVLWRLVGGGAVSALTEGVVDGSAAAELIEKKLF